jgi:hypothetical protein
MTDSNNIRKSLFHLPETTGKLNNLRATFFKNLIIN